MRPSLSCDVISSNSGDMFAQMRLGLQFERCMRNDRDNAQGRMPERLQLTVRDALRWGTANGAHAIGIEDRIGSVTVGKQADLIVVGGGRLNMTPMADPVGCLVAQANPSNVKHVLVAGRFVKRDGELCGVDVAAGDAARERGLRTGRAQDLRPGPAAAPAGSGGLHRRDQHGRGHQPRAGLGDARRGLLSALLPSASAGVGS